MDFLTLTLHGPMAAWGGVAVGEQRPSETHPTKSAMLGMLGAALGIRRDDEDALQALASAYHFGVRVDASGALLRDYHTAQVPPARRKVVYLTRRDELQADGLYTILSQRDYRMEALYTVALWQAESNAPYTLQALAEALRTPTFVLYLGRKSCPPSLPLAPGIVTAESLREAFDKTPNPGEEFLAALTRDKQRRYYWEGLSDVEAGMVAGMRVKRRDQPRNRRHWQFEDREECYAIENLREGGA